jgi:hypothetical protein
MLGWRPITVMLWITLGLALADESVTFPLHQKNAGELSLSDVEISDETPRSLQWSKVTSQVELPVEAVSKLGKGDFTISLWLMLGSAEPAGGDVLFAEDRQGNGLSLAVVTRSGATSSLSSNRQLIFSLHDDSSDIGWIDQGRPGQAIYVHSLAIHEGSLYAGVCQPGESERGEVFRYELPNQWISVGAPDDSNAVTSLASFGGSLYAGTGKYRLTGSSLAESSNNHRGGRLYRRDQDGSWQPVGELLDADAVGGMVVFKNRLWVSSLYKPARLYSWDLKGVWKEERLPETDRRVESMAVHDGKLYATSYDNAHVYRFDGDSWMDLGSVGENTQTYAFACYRRHLYVSTWPSGRVFRLSTADGWEDTGRLGDELEVMGLAVHRGRLWGGTLPRADVYSYREGGPWTKSGNVDATPAVKYRRAWTMAVHRGELFVGTLPSGHVWSTSVGQSVSGDHAFPDGWHHVSIRRAGPEISLWIDGEQAGRSTAIGDKRVSLENVHRLTLGQGDHYPFQGRMRNLKIHAASLSANDIKRESSHPPR